MSTGSWGDQKSFDCNMRQLCLDFANKIQPFRSKAHFQMIADALNGAPEAQNCSVTVSDQYGVHCDKINHSRKLQHDQLQEDGKSFYVDAEKGEDSQTGTINSPFKTIPRAVEAARDAGYYSTIVLREGTFYLTDAIELDTRDKGLTIQNYQMEQVWISGGKVIAPKWEKYNVDPSRSSNIYKADISSHGIRKIPGLRVNTKRGIRARYPGLKFCYRN